MYVYQQTEGPGRLKELRFETVHTAEGVLIIMSDYDIEAAINAVNSDMRSARLESG